MNQDQKALFWADRVVEQIKERVENNPKLQEVVEENGYICYDEKTPSGKIHIGSGRGWVIHDIIAKALRSEGLKGRFILSADDMDPMDSLPHYLDEEKFKPYMGVPFRNIPWNDNESYAEHFFKDVTDKFDEYGIEAEIESTGERYIRGDFNDTIKVVLDNATQIQDIYREMYGDDVATTDKLPFNPICEQCGKIGTTVATTWDAEAELLTYECRPDHVTWAEGCGHSGEISPYNGNGKFPWKVEWAAKWIVVGVVYESAGKDHFSAGGARDVSVRIANRVIKYPPPLPSEGEKTGKGYEFFNVGGVKMATSKGTGVSFSEMTQYAPGYLLRYILARSQPTTAIDFQFKDSNHMILYYDQYDQTERIYFGEETMPDPRDVRSQKRLYELAHVGEIPDTIPVQVPFRTILDVVQVTKSDTDALKRLIAMGKVPNDVDKQNRQYVLERIHYARNWAPYAPKHMRFQVTNDPSADHLDNNEQQAIKSLIKVIRSYKTEDEIKAQMGNIMKEFDIKARRFFKMIYQIVFGKSRGPRLIPFIFTLGREQFADLLERAIE